MIEIKNDNDMVITRDDGTEQLMKILFFFHNDQREKDYYFLADADKEDLDLSDKQEEKWEEMPDFTTEMITSMVSSGISSLLKIIIDGFLGFCLSIALMKRVSIKAMIILSTCRALLLRIYYNNTFLGKIQCLVHFFADFCISF